MNRNVESHFSMLPKVDIPRSRFDRSSTVKFSLDAGRLVPFYIDEVLPGDTFSVDSARTVRSQTLLAPIMDNLYMDTYYFFVPNRLVWEHWENFQGQNDESPWIPETQYSVPQITAPPGGWQVDSIADYMGIPIGVENLSVNALPFRGYALICNEWFRDENLSDPLQVPINDSTVVGSNGDNDIVDCAKGGMCYRPAKYHDYFTSGLPSPQKGPDVFLPVGETAPVFGNGEYGIGIHTKRVSQSFTGTMISKSGYLDSNFTEYDQPGDNLKLFEDGTNPVALSLITKDDALAAGGVNRSGLVADLSSVSGATINQLRMAFQIQKLYERDARGGTRYIEILKSHFGVTSPDSRLQRPEYLGGNRIGLNINQVVQQSATNKTGTPQGNTAAYSYTTNVNSDFTQSFTEHGFVIGLCAIRYNHTYQQGIERFWSRKTRFDYYMPVFANIGEQAVLNREIYAQGTAQDDEVFCYQEAWADYRYKPDRVAGMLRSTYTQGSLDLWHLGDKYDSLPKLSDAWIREDGSTVDRILAVSERVSDQFICDMMIRNRCVRPMPLYSIPGLIDHH